MLSCKQCYECQQYEFCLDCVGATNSGSVYFDECYTTEKEREDAFQAIQAGQGGSNISCEKIDTKIADLTEEECFTKRETDQGIDNREADGFKCIEQ